MFDSLLRTIRGRLLLIFLSLLPLFIMQNCSQPEVDLKRVLESQAKADTHFCLSPPSGKRVYNNVLFVVDQSGSNGPHSPSEGVNLPGSDPDKTIRGSAIEDYFSRHREDPFYRWGFVYYSGQAVSSYINAGDDQVPTFENSQRMSQALEEFYTNPDVSGSFGTDYTRALQLVENAVMNHDNLTRDIEGEDQVYTVFFLSDGRPMENSQARPIVGANDNRIQKIEALKGLASGPLTLSTAYYYNSLDLEAETGLKLMAQTGSGSYTDAVTQGGIQFVNPSTGEKEETWRIKRTRLITFNLNSAICRSGEIGTDSDADGLCDKDELAFNENPSFQDKLNGMRFDPQSRYSVHPSYADSFVWKYQMLATGQGLNNCQNAEPDEDHDFLNSCEEAQIYDRNANGPFPEWRIPGSTANKKNPDSDGDTLLDWIEFSWLLMDSGTSAPVNFNNILDFYSNDVSAERLILEHRSLLRPDVFDQSSYDTRLRFRNVNSQGQNCYSFKQDQLALYPTLAVTADQTGNNPDLAHAKGENKILVYFLATKDDSPNSYGVLYHSIKTFQYDEKQQEKPLQIKPDLSDFEVFFIESESF